MRKIRIPLNDKNTVITYIYDEKYEDGNFSFVSFLTDAVKITLVAAELSVLPDYYFSRYPHPCVSIDLTVSEDDRPVVSGWLGNASSSSRSPSESLVKRMTSAVTNSLKQYFTDASRRGLFTRPFKLGYALKLLDGTILTLGSPQEIYPTAMAPLMAIRDANLSDSMLRTMTEIINTPADLKISVSSFDLPTLVEILTQAGFSSQPESLVIFATQQCDVLTGEEIVSSIRTIELFGDRVPSWSYNRLAEDLVAQKLKYDNSFRIISEIPILEVSDGLDSLRLPANNRDLTDWKSFTPFIYDDVNNKIPTRMVMETDPIDLNLPEEYKKLRCVTLRGCFPRDITGNCVRYTLFGSHHRENWKVVATAQGAHIRFLRASYYRWYKLKIESPCPAVFDAVTFDIQNKRTTH